MATVSKISFDKIGEAKAKRFATESEDSYVVIAPEIIDLLASRFADYAFEEGACVTVITDPKLITARARLGTGGSFVGDVVMPMPGGKLLNLENITGIFSLTRWGMDHLLVLEYEPSEIEGLIAGKILPQVR